MYEHFIKPQRYHKEVFCSYDISVIFLCEIFFSHSRSLITFTLVVVFFMTANQSLADECHLTPVIHKLQYPGCQDVTIPSYACVGRCTSYVKVWYWNLKKKKSYLFFKKLKIILMLFYEI